MYTELSHINAALAAIGELPVNDVDTPHPEVPAIRAALLNRSVQLQDDGWWFNTEYPTLQPQAGNKQIVLPNNVLSIDSTVSQPAVVYRAGKLYNLDTSTFEFERSVRVRLIRFIKFDDLPMSARFYFSHSALKDAISNLDADSSKMRKASDDESRAYRLFHTEHIRNTQTNMMDRPTFAWRIRQVVGDSPFAQRNIR